jgi:4'-phosphopantetheinyl transferase
MAAPGWLSRSLADVPAGYGWLGEREREVLAGLRFERRRNDWLLGRWTAKAAVSGWLSIPINEVEILAAPDGAPDAWIGAERAPVSISISHRGGRSFAVLDDSPAVAGCDLELIEPRSAAFVSDWLSPGEQSFVAACDRLQRPLLANLIWTAKEAASKVRRAGLRLDVRRAEVTLRDDPVGAGQWHALEVAWGEDRPSTCGWWRTEPGWVMSVAGEPAPERPQQLSLRQASRKSSAISSISRPSCQPRPAASRSY